MAVKGLNSKQAALFWRHISLWQQKFSLMEWEILKSHKSPGSMSAGLEEPNQLQHTVDVILGTGWGDEELRTEKLIEKTACHEMMHLLLDELAQMAIKRGASSEEVTAAEHKIINRVSQVLFR
jgi:hypothetical protein